MKRSYPLPPTDPRPIFIGSEVYRGSSYGDWHPLRVPRVSTVMDMVGALDWLEPGQYRTSPKAKPAGLIDWHTPDYVAALQRAEKTQTVTEDVRARHHLGTASNPVFPEVFSRPATGAGGALLSAALLADRGVVHCPGCGTHHGMPDRANGFCFLNDLVLGVRAMRRHGIQRIAYVDIDAHHPDGVEHAFANDPDVLMISVHEENRWPRTGGLDDRGVGNVFNLPVPSGLNDDEFAFIRDALILPKLSDFRPDAIVLQCGADAVTEDPLSRLSLSNNAHVGVLEGVRPLAPRLLVTGGGGYNPWSVGRLWTRVWAVLTDREPPDRLPPAAEKVLRNLTWTMVPKGREPQEPWMTTLVDPPRPGPIRFEIKARVRALTPKAL